VDEAVAGSNPVAHPSESLIDGVFLLRRDFVYLPFEADTAEQGDPYEQS
jgi:hypothetical protein